MNKEAILGIARHILTFVGGAGVTSGLMTSSDLTTGVSALMTLIGLIWSMYEKYMRAQAAPKSAPRDIWKDPDHG